jgi:hypothetical protein
MKRVIIESPFAGRHGNECICHQCLSDVQHNLRYLRAAMHDCFMRGEAPFASHGLYTQEGVLDDKIAGERKLGIDAGLAWGLLADLSALYIDMGISRGMKYGVEAANRVGRPIEQRSLAGWGPL